MNGTAGIEAVRNQLAENEPMSWPSVANEPLNEYQVSNLATIAFPTLFPDGKGDPTNQSILRDIPLQERIKHLLKFTECNDDKWVYRFASHPRFLYWAFRFKESVFFSKVEFFSSKIQMKLISPLMDYGKWLTVTMPIYLSKISRYVGNIAGTNACWNRVRDELKAIIINVGPPTLFFFLLFPLLICIVQNCMLHLEQETKIKTIT